MDGRIKQTLESLTLLDKLKLLSGKDYWRLYSIPEQGIREIMVSDGPHGLRKQDDAQDNLGINDSIEATCFPNAVSMASSFDKQLMFKLGETLGDECLAENVAILLGPGVNIKRSPLCGRNFEYFSEDPYLAGVMAENFIKGVQSKGVGTSLKHFACNNQETRRTCVSSVVDERALREIYLSAFERAIKNAKPWSVMCSYNKINGVYSSENPYLLTDILRNEWGFDGFVMSDWGAVIDRDKALKAGLDLEMPSSAGRNTKLLAKKIADGEIDEADADKSCGKIIEAIYRYQDSIESLKEPKIYDRKADHDIASSMARECLVLLKNDGMLPLNKDKKVVFIGELAEYPRYQGGGSSHINSKNVNTVKEIIKNYPNVNYVRGYELNKERSIDDELLVEAINAAGSSDAAVLFLGLPESFESEGRDRNHIDLPYNQFQLIKELCKVQKNIAIVLSNGSPIAMSWIDEVSAVIEAYLPGEAGAEAIVDTIYGDNNPSGKLAETFPISLYDTATEKIFPGERLTTEYRESIYVGYRYYDKANKAVLFPFGHGLSYTEFKYNDLVLNKTKIGANEGITVSFSVQNIGGIKGKEAAQIYIGAPQDSDVFMPVKQLYGFEKIELSPDETKNLKIDIEPRAFQYYNTKLKDWTTLSGIYTVYIGSSSRDIRAECQIVVECDNARSPYNKETLPTYFNGDVARVSVDEWQTLYGRELPRAQRQSNGNITKYDTFEDAQQTRWGRLILKIILHFAPSDNSLGETNMFVDTIKFIPFINLAALSNGAVNDDLIDDMLNLFNKKHQIRSLCRLLKKGLKLKKQIVD